MIPPDPNISNPNYLFATSAVFLKEIGLNIEPHPPPYVTNPSIPTEGYDLPSGVKSIKVGKVLVNVTATAPPSLEAYAIFHASV